MRGVEEGEEQDGMERNVEFIEFLTPIIPCGRVEIEKRERGEEKGKRRERRTGSR